MSDIVVIGSGMAGCGASHRFAQDGLRPLMLDQRSFPGGHTASFAHDGGWIFDDGPHISFTKNERIQELFANSVGGEFQVIQARVNNYFRGHWVKHPAQCNLHGLPADLVVDCLKDFVAAQQTDPGQVRNYADWLLASYGTTFAETFPMQYGKKYHTTTADNMSTDWLGPRLYRPSLEEVLRGAICEVTPEVHYVDHFRYPTHGGFEAYLRPFFELADLRLNTRVVGIDSDRRMLRVENGSERGYEHLVSSVPLPELVAMIDRVPERVREAAGRLAVTTCVLVNIGVGRENVGDAHWTYFYDDDFVFTRLSFPHRLSPHTVPAGCSSVQCEIYFSDKYRPLDRAGEAFIEPAIADLRRCGLLREDDPILFRDATVVPHANVIFDLERQAAVAEVHAFLDEKQIAYCGRYGEWGYHWTDESFESGERAAEAVLDRAGG